MAAATHLLIHRYRPGTGPQEGTSAHDAEMAQWEEVDRQLRADGVLVGAHALRDSGTLLGPGAQRVELNSAAEIVFAVHVIAVAGDAEAERIAATLPTLGYGTVEVRPLMG